MRYLSEEWITAADLAVKAAAATAPTLGLIIDQHVDDALDYRVTIQRDDASVRKLNTDRATDLNAKANATADATFAQSLATAQAVAQGTTDAHQAFLLGHIRFSGDIDVLIERRDAFDWLATALEPVLAATTF